MELQKKFESEKKTKNQQESHEQQKEQNLQSIKNLHQLTDNENKSTSESFDSISNRIHALAGAKMSEAESREAARRLISFCQLIIDYKIKRNTQSEKEAECKNKSANSIANSAKTVKSEETI